MATVTATAALSTSPAYGHGLAQNAKRVSASYEFTSNPAAATTVEMVRVPAGAVITGGWLRGNRIDAATSTAALDVDVGYSDDTDALGNFGVLAATAVAGVKPASDYLYALHGVLASGALSLTSETVISLLINASATTFATGKLSLTVDYYVP